VLGFSTSKDLGRVSCIQMEVAMVKQGGYVRPFWLHPKKDNKEGGGPLHIIHMEF